MIFHRLEFFYQGLVLKSPVRRTCAQLLFIITEKLERRYRMVLAYYRRGGIGFASCFVWISRDFRLPDAFLP